MKVHAAFAIVLMSGLIAGVSSARADEIPISVARARCAAGDVGPRTVYGETPAEASAKKIAFEWACGVLVEGRVKQAFAQYVAKDFCDHGHLVTAGLERCGTYAETLRDFERMSGRMVHNGMIEFPTSAAVDGEMVTQYGAGADIFRVHDGKITDHWDASPPVDVSLKAHGKAFADHMQQQIDEGRRLPGGPFSP